ncbi:MAG: hypothetical protein ACU843_07430 [Gammaproteobacteria bacterium]
MNETIYEIDTAIKALIETIDKLINQGRIDKDMAEDAKKHLIKAVTTFGVAAMKVEFGNVQT